MPSASSAVSAVAEASVNDTAATAETNSSVAEALPPRDDASTLAIPMAAQTPASVPQSRRLSYSAVAESPASNAARSEVVTTANASASANAGHDEPITDMNIDDFDFDETGEVRRVLILLF